MIKAKEIKLVELKRLKLNPKNRNSHPDDQIERLMKLIEHQGFRQPLIVSKRSGLVLAGHGRFEAAKRLGLKKLPVIYQEFESEEQEYAFAVSDNAIGAWSELDLSGINTDVPDLGPDFDIDLLGMKSFTIEPAEKLDAEEPEPKEKLKSCPSCGYEW